MRVHGAHQLDEPIVDDADHLLARLEALGHLPAEGVVDDLVAEGRDHVEVHIGLEQGRAHVAHRVADVVFRDPAAAGELAEGVAQALGE